MTDYRKKSLAEIAGEILRDPTVANRLDPEMRQRLLMAEINGTVVPGDLPIEEAKDRARGLESPFWLMTQVVDPFYGQHFEEKHRVLLDDVMRPYLLGESLKLDGVSYEPTDYLGLLILWARGTFKSSCTTFMSTWDALHARLRRKFDARHLYCHQVLDKAIICGDRQKSLARSNKRFRRLYREFAHRGGQWDTQTAWRWPSFRSHAAGEWSFQAYGETSSKTGGHYTAHFIDDWVTEESVTTPQQLDQSEERFRGMDNLRDRARAFTPRIVTGTHYHYQDVYKRLEKDGGWLIWKVPVYSGSPRRIFDLAAVDTRTDAGRRKVAVGLKGLEQDPPGALNFPHLFPWKEVVASVKAQGPHIAGCQLWLDPVPEGEQRFDHEALVSAVTDEIPLPSESWAYIRCDPAISVKRDRDETAIHVCLVDWRGWRWFVDGWSGREKRPTEIVRRLFALARSWQKLGYRVQNIGIESVAYQEALAELCRLGVPEREARFHGESLPILKSPCAVRSIHRSADMRKQERILEMDGPVSRREIRILKTNPVLDKFLTQLKNFPFDRDDLLDAAHDCWDGVLIPPREMVAGPKVHSIFKKYLAKRMRNDGEPKLVGTSGEAKLSAWG